MKITNKRKNKRRAMAIPRTFSCPNCGAVLREGQGHFMPPSLGERGEWMCPDESEQNDKP